MLSNHKLNVHAIIKLVFILLCSLLAACSIYKFDTRQGNQITQSTLDRLKPKQTITEVQQILGTPALNRLSDRRLDYYYNELSNIRSGTRYHIALFFDEQGGLNHYTTDGTFKIKHLPEHITKK